jgi:hypothetical protein
MKTRTHDSWRREADGSITKEGRRNGLRDGAAGHVLTDMTSRVTVTEGAEADAALGERGDGLEHCGPCARTGGWEGRRDLHSDELDIVNEVCDVRGLAVRGRRQFGNVKRSRVQKARVRRRANRRTGEENNRSKSEVNRK